MINLLLNVSREHRGIFQRDKEISWNIMSTCLIGAYWTLALYLLTKELWLNYVANIWRIMKPTLKATMKLMLLHGCFFLLNYAQWKIRCLCKYINFHWLYWNLLNLSQKRLLVYDVFPLHRFFTIKRFVYVHFFAYIVQGMIVLCNYLFYFFPNFSQKTIKSDTYHYFYHSKVYDKVMKIQTK